MSCLSAETDWAGENSTRKFCEMINIYCCAVPAIVRKPCAGCGRVALPMGQIQNLQAHCHRHLHLPLIGRHVHHRRCKNDPLATWDFEFGLCGSPLVASYSRNLAGVPAISTMKSSGYFLHCDIRSRFTFEKANFLHHFCGADPTQIFWYWFTAFPTWRSSGRTWKRRAYGFWTRAVSG